MYINNEHALALDVSFWDDDPSIDWAYIKSQGVELIIAKAGQRSWVDGMFVKHIEGALSAGLKVAAYWWLDPTYDYKKQMQMFEQIACVYPMEFLALDIEQSKGYVWHPKNKKGGGSWSLGTINSKTINDTAWASAAYLSANHTETQIVIYTRTGFINQYAPQMVTWIYHYGVWLAAYPYTESPAGNWGNHVFTCDKEDADKFGFTYVESWDKYMYTYAPRPTMYTPLPKNVTDWAIWQFTGDRVKLPGLDAYLDINYVHRAWLDSLESGGEIPPETPPEEGTEYRVRYLNDKTKALTVRETPSASGKFVRYIVKTSPPTAIKCTAIKSGVWVKLFSVTPEWVNSNYLTP